MLVVRWLATLVGAAWLIFALWDCYEYRTFSSNAWGLALAAPTYAIILVAIWGGQIREFLVQLVLEAEAS